MFPSYEHIAEELLDHDRIAAYVEALRHQHLA